MGTADHMASYDGVADKGGANNGVAANVVATLSFVITTASWAMRPWMMGAVDAMAAYIGTADDGVADDEVADNGLANNDCVLVDEGLRAIFAYDRTIDNGVADNEVANNGLVADDCVLGNGALDDGHHR